MDRPSPSGSALARRSPRTSTSSLTSTGTNPSSVQSGVPLPGATRTTRARAISPVVQNNVAITASASRTRLRNSHGDLTSQQPTMNPSSAKGSKDSLKSKVDKVLEPPQPSTSTAELLDTIQNEFKHIRDLITCKICYSLLYEPYTTSCGHTFCYNCFCKTFEVHKPKKCPECRTPLRTAPAPAYTLREITRKIIKKDELLPEGETVQLHKAMVEEHEQLVKKDRDGPQGLFKGLWRPAHAKCPVCGNGLEHNVCGSCGTVFNVSEELEDPDVDENYTDMTTSEELDHDFDMPDIDPGFDEDFPEAVYGESFDGWFEDDYYLDRDHLPDHLPGRHYALSRFLEEEGTDYSDLPDSYPWSVGYPEPHGMVSPRRSAPRSYAASTVSSFHDEMNTVIEEEEEDEEDEDSSSALGGTSSLGDSASAGGNATETSSRYSISSVASPNSRTSRNSLSNTGSTYSSARSTPAPNQTPVSSTSSTSRRRQRESNTPTSSIGQPRQRRRIGSVIDLTQNSSRASPSVASQQSSAQLDTESAPSTNDDSSVSSDDISEQHSQNTYVSLDDDMEDDSDGAETTVGWEPNPSSNPRSRNTGSLTPTADRPQNSHSQSQSRLSSNRGAPYQRLRSMPSVINRSVSISDMDENDADDETSSNRVVRNRRSRILRQPSIASMQVDSPIEESDSTDTPTDTPGRNQRNGSRQRSLDPDIRSRFMQHYLDIRNNSRTPLMHVDQLRDMNRTPGFGFSRPGTANRHRSTTPATAQSMATASPARNRSELARMLAERQPVTSEQPRRSSIAASVASMSQASSNAHDQDTDEGASRSQIQTAIASPLRSRAQFGPHLVPRSSEGTEQVDDWVGPRPPSVLSRRVTTPVVATRGNLGSPVHIIPPSGATNPFIQRRPSRRQMNIQASTANIRNMPSITGLRNQAARNNPITVPHRPPSRTQSRNQQRALNHTPSMMHLPQSQPSSIISYSNPQRITTPHNQVQREPEVPNDIAYTTTVRAAMSQRPDFGGLQRPANPFLQHTATRYQNGWGNDSAFGNPHIAGLNNAGPYTGPAAPARLATRRSRNNLGVPPPGVLFSTNAAMNNPQLGGAAANNNNNTAVNANVVGVNTVPPRLAQRRSQRSLAHSTAAGGGGGFMTASSLLTGGAQQLRGVGLRTPVNGGPRAEVRQASGGAAHPWL